MMAIGISWLCFLGSAVSVDLGQCEGSVAIAMIECEAGADAAKIGVQQAQKSTVAGSPSKQEYERRIACMQTSGFELDWDLARKSVVTLQLKSSRAYYRLIWDRAYWRRGNRRQ